MPIPAPEFTGKVFTEVSTGVVLTDQVAATVGVVFSIEIQRNLCAIIPTGFPLILKLIDTGTTDMSDSAEFGFGIIVPQDTRRARPFGPMHTYRPWGDLSTAAQKDANNQRALIVNFGVPYIFLTQGEKFVVQAYHATETVDGSACEFEIPYQEMRAEPLFVQKMLEQRKYERQFALGV